MNGNALHQGGVGQTDDMARVRNENDLNNDNLIKSDVFVSIILRSFRPITYW